MPVNVTVWARVALPGLHRWPNAPEHRAYLRNRHRHLFHVLAAVQVRHHDRDVEFHDLGDMIRSWWRSAGAHPVTSVRECGEKSCEHLARELWSHLDQHKLAVARVEVSEDGECGATLTKE